MTKRIAPFFILLAAILWGTTGTAQALAPSSAHPIAIGSTRLFIGGCFLFLLVLLTDRIQWKNWPVLTTLFAAISMALYQPLFFSAVSITGVAIGTVVAIGSAPIFSGGIEWIIDRSPPPKVWWISTILSIIGCILLFLNNTKILVEPMGIFLALGAGMTFASYTRISHQLIQTHSSIAVVAVVFILSAMILSPFLFFFDMTWIGNIRGLLVAIQLGVVATGIAYFLFSKGLESTSASTAVTLSLAEPLTATLLGVFLLKESLTTIAVFGIFCVILGLGFLLFIPRKAKVAHSYKSNFQ